MTVTFFGNRDTPPTVRPILEKVLTDLIENHGAKQFIVGNQGNFDAMVLQTLHWLKPVYPEIMFCVVLAYMPIRRDAPSFKHPTFTIVPEGLEFTPHRYCIDKRNRWMVTEADTVITYTPYSFGGAAKFKNIAQKKGKQVIELSEI